MFHVTRNAHGVVQSIARLPSPDTEALPETHPDVVQFLGQAATDTQPFSSADAEFVRVLEDLIDTLIVKNVIRQTDLPAAAQDKLMRRKGLRTQIHGALNLFGSDDRIL